MSLVAEQQFSQFHDVLWWSKESYSCIPRWNEEAATLESFDQRVNCAALDVSPRLTQKGDTFRYVRDNLTDVQTEAADGSGALMIVKTIRLSVGPKSTQEAVRLLLDFFRLYSLRRNYGETMRYWTRRFTLQCSKVGQALIASNAEISKDSLHENIRGILLAETSGLTSSEFASVLATGTTGAEGESICNSWKIAHLVEAFSTQWCDAALAARDDAKARKSEVVAATVDNFDLSGLSEATSRIENAISRNDADQHINAYEDDDDEYYEEDVEWYTGDCDDELDETAYTVGTLTDDPELLEQFDGNLEDAASASQVYASASRSFQEAPEFLSLVRSARGYFLVVGIGAFDGRAQPSADRKPAESRGEGKKGKRKDESSSQKSGKPTNLGTGILPKPQPHVPSLVLRCPRSVRLRLAQLVVDITLLVFVLTNACCVDKLDIVHHSVPTKAKRLHSHLTNRHLVPMLWVVQCSLLRVMVQLSKKPNKIKTRMTSKTLLRFQSRVLRVRHS